MPDRPVSCWYVTQSALALAPGLELVDALVPPLAAGLPVVPGLPAVPVVAGTRLTAGGGGGGTVAACSGALVGCACGCPHPSTSTRPHPISQLRITHHSAPPRRPCRATHAVRPTASRPRVGLSVELRSADCALGRRRTEIDVSSQARSEGSSFLMERAVAAT